MCDNFCKYRDTMDRDGEGDCDWIRKGEKCSLDKIQRGVRRTTMQREAKMTEEQWDEIMFKGFGFSNA